VPRTLAAFAVIARIRTVFADKGYDAERHRKLCRRFGAEPDIHKRGQPHGSGLGKRRRPVERSNAWVLENRRLAPTTPPVWPDNIIRFDAARRPI
jgi:transposase